MLRSITPMSAQCTGAEAPTHHPACHTALKGGVRACCNQALHPTLKDGVRADCYPVFRPALKGGVSAFRYTDFRFDLKGGDKARSHPELWSCLKVSARVHPHPERESAFPVSDIIDTKTTLYVSGHYRGLIPLHSLKSCHVLTPTYSCTDSYAYLRLMEQRAVIAYPPYGMTCRYALTPPYGTTYHYALTPPFKAEV